MVNDDQKDIVISEQTGQVLEREQQPKTTGLTPAQKDRMVEAGAYVAEGLVDIAKTLIEIAKNDRAADADVRRIHANTDQVVSKLRAEADRLRSRGELARTKGKAVVDILIQMKQFIISLPEEDREVRLRVLDMLPGIIDKALSPE